MEIRADLDDTVIKVSMDKRFSKPRFYTSLPDLVIYDYPLYPLNDAKLFERKPYIHGILDTGIALLAKTSMVDYPKYFYPKWERTNIPRTWKIIPDYRPNKFFDSFERTYENVQKYYVKGENKIPVFQDKDCHTSGEAKKQIDINIQRFIKEIDDNPEALMVSMKAISHKPDVIKYKVTKLRKAFPKTWLHAFGVGADILKTISHCVDSWDTRAWSFARSTKKRSMMYKKGILKKTFIDKYEERDFFIEYLQRIPTYCNFSGRKIYNNLQDLI